ncbi:HlyD family type I secretion periplasmic adaptor subunit [Microbulbifer spongiae]|uniref:Membrane fusion protein (MFP) family protein n=1 Tax=Microbulbifer spongiae TaxID=2944933 RepID=A0ABY9E7A0_9GAMM|nr:HlyD family type I secretion periplasmic adaptor subunit [Microbulbifer sp. MI-G]WKD48900.1 HlyD family type I secretion periplasmic adaptor subunit [Microbulbifer sp. MI-G]
MSRWRSLLDLRRWIHRRDPTLDFVPAALEVEQSPPNPLGLWLINTVCLFFAMAVLWAIFGRIDIVAVAEGTVIPDGKVKTIQAKELSVVRKIHVEEGSQVRAGDPLITLDATNATADREQLISELEVSRARLVREQVFNAYLSRLRKERVSAMDMALGELEIGLAQAGVLQQLPFQRTLLSGYFSDYLSEVDLLEQQRSSKQKELGMSRALVRKAEKTLPILTERTNSLRKLLDQEMVARDRYLELEQQRIDAEEELVLERERIGQYESQLQELNLQASALLNNALYKSYSQQEELERTLAAQEKALAKARLRSEQQVIRAPIAGTVQELAIHTEDAVLEPAQALMQIVPAGSRLQVQAWVLNKDIGFVKEGHPVTVKISTYNFTKYGTVSGVVTNLSKDAVMNEEQGYRYLCDIELDTQMLKQSGQGALPLRAGMHVVAELKTGKRNIYEYFTKPVRESLASSFTER